MLGEPTNDLDIDTLTALEDVLDGWVGTLVVVSHDRYLLERITDRQVALLGDGRLRDLPGGVDQYLALRSGGATQPGPRPPATATAAASAAGAAPVPADAVPASRVAASGAERYAVQKEVTAIERRLEKLAEAIARLHRTLADHDPSDYEGLNRHTRELRALEDEVGQLEDRWLDLADAAD